MSTSIFWTLPPSGDGRGKERVGWTRGDFAFGPRPFPTALSDERAGKYGYYDHLAQLARASEVAGFDGVYVPWDPIGEDPWIVTSSLARETRRLQFLPELQVGFATPVYLAKMSVSFQRLSGNRLAWKVDLDREPVVRRAHGDFLTGNDWFERADEFLSAAKGVISARPYEFRGRFYEVEAGGLEGPLAGASPPRVYTSGHSEAALAFAAKHSDVHVVEGLSPARVRQELLGIQDAGAARGRQVKTAVRLGIVARHSDEEAHAAARELSASARGRGEPLIGSYSAVAARLDQYLALGVDTLILGANPHLEEAYRLGEHVLPKLSSRSFDGALQRSQTPFYGGI